MQWLGSPVLSKQAKPKAASTKTVKPKTLKDFDFVVSLLNMQKMAPMRWGFLILCFKILSFSSLLFNFFFLVEQEEGIGKTKATTVKAAPAVTKPKATTASAKKSAAARKVITDDDESGEEAAVDVKKLSKVVSEIDSMLTDDEDEDEDEVCLFSIFTY